VLKDLINYFRDLHKAYDTRAKTLLSASNVINNTTIPSNFLTSGGLGDAIYVLRDFHKQGLAEANKAKDLQNEVVMQLTGLRSDLQQKIKEIKSLSGDFKNSVDKEQEGTRRAVRALQEALGMVDTDANATSGKGDPFLIKMGVDRQLEKQIEEENYLHRVCVEYPRRNGSANIQIRHTSIWKHLAVSLKLSLSARSRRRTMSWQASSVERRPESLMLQRS
jgi:hypothetical protein